MPSRIISLRIDDETREMLRAAEKRTSRTRTAIVVAAIKDYYVRTLGPGRARPFELVEDLVGSIDGPAEALSVRTGEKFRAKLARKRR